jgi:hypothetical protein
VSNSMYGMPEARHGDTVEVLVVLLKCLRIMHESSGFNPWERLESVFGEAGAEMMGVLAYMGPAFLCVGFYLHWDGA